MFIWKRDCTGFHSLPSLLPLMLYLGCSGRDGTANSCYPEISSSTFRTPGSKSLLSSIAEESTAAPLLQVPHGLMPSRLGGKAQEVHDDINGAHGKACARRLSHLRHLVAQRSLEEAVDLSLALVNTQNSCLRNKRCRLALSISIIIFFSILLVFCLQYLSESHGTSLPSLLLLLSCVSVCSTIVWQESHQRLSHPDCLQDMPFIGEATMATKVATPQNRRGPHPDALQREEEEGLITAVPVVTTTIKLHRNDDVEINDAQEEEQRQGQEQQHELWMPALHAVTAPAASSSSSNAAGHHHHLPHRMLSAARVPVVGFTLDGKFVLAESPLRCRRRRITTATSDGDYGGGGDEGGEEFGGSSSGGLVCDGGADVRNHVVADAQEALTLLAPRLLSPSPSSTSTSSSSSLPSSTSSTPPHSWTTTTESRSKSRRSPPRNRRLGGMGTEGHSMPKPPIPVGGSAVEQPQLVDLVNSYAVGTKSLLAIATYPSDASNGGTQSFPYGYCYGKVQSQFGCSSDGSSAVAYLKRALATSSNFYKESSWDKMRLAVTVTPLLRTTYRGASCGSFEPLDYWSGGSASALDVAAYAAAKTRGFNRASFDFNVVFMPRCPTLSFSGIGWIGAPGSLINLFANDFDASVSHEIGHNLGNMYFL